MQVEIWSDIMCPFCYIGKRRFEKAMATFEGSADIEVIWKSYQLDPKGLFMIWTGLLLRIRLMRIELFKWLRQSVKATWQKKLFSKPILQKAKILTTHQF